MVRNGRGEFVHVSRERLSATCQRVNHNCYRDARFWLLSLTDNTTDNSTPTADSLVHEQPWQLLNSPIGDASRASRDGITNCVMYDDGPSHHTTVYISGFEFAAAGSAINVPRTRCGFGTDSRPCEPTIANHRLSAIPALGQ